MCQLATNSVNKLDLSKIIATLPVFLSRFTCVLREIHHTPPKAVKANFSMPIAKINKPELLSSDLGLAQMTLSLTFQHASCMTVTVMDHDVSIAEGLQKHIANGR